MLTYGSTNIISESIVSTIDNLVEKATLKSLNDAIQSFLKKFSPEILFKYPQPLSILIISKFFEYESRTVMAVLIAKDLNDLFEILFKECKLFPVCIVNDNIYVIDKVVHQILINGFWNGNKLIQRSKFIIERILFTCIELGQ